MSCCVPVAEGSKSSRFYTCHRPTGEKVYKKYTFIKN
jgi:hypothetical protein